MDLIEPSCFMTIDEPPAACSMVMLSASSARAGRWPAAAQLVPPTRTVSSPTSMTRLPSPSVRSCVTLPGVVGRDHVAGDERPLVSTPTGRTATSPRAATRGVPGGPERADVNRVVGAPLRWASTTRVPG